MSVHDDTGLTPRSGDELRREAARFVESPLRQAVAGLEGPLRRMAEYHFGWIDAEGTPTDSQENVVRHRGAAFTLVAAGSDRASWSRARNVAVANTLMMAALFLHDDLVDRDQIRYGRTAVWKAFSIGAAVHLGDALLALAFQVLDNKPERTKDSLRSRMASCIGGTCRG